MKRHLLYFLLFALALGSCKKNKTEPFMENPDERISAKLSEYQTLLTTAEFGWKAYLLTDLKLTGAFLFSFDGKNRVKMLADYDEEKKPIESSYRLKAMQRLTLIFDTYSNLHMIVDPTPSVAGGIRGQGYRSDFEFAIISANADTIKLEGTFYKSKLYLIRSKSEADNLAAFSAKYDFNNNVLSKLRTYFKRVIVDDMACDISFNPKASIFIFRYLEAEKLKSISVKCFVPDAASLVFFEPVTIGNKTLIGIKDLSFDASSNLIKTTTNYGESFQIEEARTPLYYDPKAADRFIKNPINFSSYSKSATGFTVDSEIDAYKLREIEFFTGIFYIHKYKNYSFGMVGFAVAPPPKRKNTYLSYAPGILPSISADGILSYKQVATLDNPDLPPPGAEIKSKIDKTTKAFLTEKGFYVIQTSETTYDLVAADDARKWITFE